MAGLTVSAPGFLLRTMTRWHTATPLRLVSTQSSPHHTRLPLPLCALSAPAALQAQLPAPPRARVPTAQAPVLASASTGPHTVHPGPASPLGPRHRKDSGSASRHAPAADPGWGLSAPGRPVRECALCLGPGSALAHLTDKDPPGQNGATRPAAWGRRCPLSASVYSSADEGSKPGCTDAEPRSRRRGFRSTRARGTPRTPRRGPLAERCQAGGGIAL